MELDSGEKVKKVRLELGLTQEDMICKGLEQTYISRIENGELELTPQKAIIFSNKFNLERKRRNIDLGYKITPSMFLPVKKSEIDRLINNLKENMKYCYIEINEFLESCTNELAEELINRMYTDVFKYNIYKYREEAREYLTKQVKFMQDRKNITEAYIRIIATWVVDRSEKKYEEIVFLGKLIENDVELCDDNRRMAYYTNVSLAYYKTGEDGVALDLIEKGKKIENNRDLFRILNTEASICVRQKSYTKAINIHKRIIRESNNIKFIANSYSNLADIYNTINNLELANEYSNKAFEFIEDLDIHYKYNLYYVKLQIEIEQNIDIFSTFRTTFKYANELDNRNKEEDVLNLAINYYKKGHDSKLEDIIEMLYKGNIETKATLLMELYPLITNNEIRKMIFEMPRY